jgi:hypothetical protein
MALAKEGVLRVKWSSESGCMGAVLLDLFVHPTRKSVQSELLGDSLSMVFGFFGARSLAASDRAKRLSAHRVFTLQLA